MADWWRLALPGIFGTTKSTFEDKCFPRLGGFIPRMKGAAQFFLDTLVDEPSHHWLVTCPSISLRMVIPVAAGGVLRRTDHGYANPEGPVCQLHPRFGGVLES